MTKMKKYITFILYIVLLQYANMVRAIEPVPEALKALQLHDEAIAAIDASFLSPEKDVLTIADFEPQITVVNFWATWCAPCVHEMPSISRLKAALKDDVTVLTIATGRNQPAALARFYRDTAIENLPAYTDPSQEFARAYDVLGLPVTLILNEKGEEIARLTGDAVWDDQSVIEWFKGL